MPLWVALLLLPVRAGSPTEDLEATLSAAKSAQRKGFHQKAYDHYKKAHRQLSGQSAWEHTELQEGLCVCAARLRKEKVAITACENATQLRASSPSSPPLSLLMAQGEAKLFAEEPVSARVHFKHALKKAASGEALRLEKGARDALRRAEGRLFSSYSRQRGVCAGKVLLTSTYPMLADALDACTSLRGCKAVGVSTLASQRGVNGVRATLFDSAEVSSDVQKPPTARQWTYLRDLPEHGYVLFPGSTLDRAAYPRMTPPVRGISGELLTVGRAMHLCDAAAAAGHGCGGFLLGDLDGEEVDPNRRYRIEFRSRKAAANAPPSDAVHPSSGHAAFAREKPFELPPPQSPQPKPQPTPQARAHQQQQPPPGGRGRGGGGGGSGWGDYFGFGGGGGPFGGGGDSARRGGGGGRGGFGGGSGFGRQPRAPPAKPRRDYYQILKVGKDASARQIKKAYHARARQWHPDKNRGPGDEKRLVKAERNFKLSASATTSTPPCCHARGSPTCTHAAPLSDLACPTSAHRCSCQGVRGPQRQAESCGIRPWRGC